MVIRTCINRPDITYIIKTIPKENIENYDILYYFLDNIVDTNGNAILKNILKTIIFVDGRIGMLDLTL